MTVAPVRESPGLLDDLRLGKSRMTNNLKGMLGRIGAAAMALTLAGCIIPLPYTAVPGVSTRLVDAKTQAPVAGAKVTLTLVNRRTKPEPSTTVSAADGSV